MTWLVEHQSGEAGTLHAASADLVSAGGVAARRRARFLHATGPAVVLGSSQADAVIDREAARLRGMGVARRRSGGSAVLVGPAEAVWVDLVVPRDDPLWSDDVGRAAWWVGDLWVRALAEVGVTGVVGWRGAFSGSRWSPLVCFAGVGPGEVVRVAGGDRPLAKLVGVSQRRSGSGALFQCAALLRWRPSDLLDVLDLAAAERGEAARDLAGAAEGLGPERARPLLDAVVAHLP